MVLLDFGWSNNSNNQVIEENNIEEHSDFDNFIRHKIVIPFH